MSQKVIVLDAPTTLDAGTGGAGHRPGCPGGSAGGSVSDSTREAAARNAEARRCASRFASDGFRNFDLLKVIVNTFLPANKIECVTVEVAPETVDLACGLIE